MRLPCLYTQRISLHRTRTRIFRTLEADVHGGLARAMNIDNIDKSCAHRSIGVLRRIGPHDTSLLIQRFFLHQRVAIESTHLLRVLPAAPGNTDPRSASHVEKYQKEMAAKGRILYPMGCRIEDLAPRATLSDCSTSIFRSPSINSHRTEELITCNGNYPRIPPNPSLSLKSDTPSEG